MRALTIILFTAVATLWIWFVVAVAPLDSRRPRPVQVIETESGVTAASLHNRGVSLRSQGRHGDALLYFERAHASQPGPARRRAALLRAGSRVPSARSDLRVELRAPAELHCQAGVGARADSAHAARHRAHDRHGRSPHDASASRPATAARPSPARRQLVSNPCQGQVGGHETAFQPRGRGCHRASPADHRLVERAPRKAHEKPPPRGDRRSACGGQAGWRAP